jgi:putative hydrolase of the HAD superfamily
VGPADRAGLPADPRPPLRAVLLDFGHTLVHYEVPDALLLQSYREAHALVATAHPQSPPPDDLVLRVAQHVLTAVRASYDREELQELDHELLYAEALAHHGYALGADTVRELIDLEHAAFVRHLLVPDATLATLRELRARGLRLGLVSNVSVPGTLMRRALDALGVSEHVEAAVFSSEIGVRKPHPHIYQTVLDALGAQPTEALFVGDRVREDVHGPRALGMRVVLTHEYRQEPVDGAEPDGVIRRFAELPALLDRLEGER